MKFYPGFLLKKAFSGVFLVIFISFTGLLHAQGPDMFSANLGTKNHFDFVFPTNNGWFKVQQQGKYTFVDSTGQLAAGWQWYDYIDNFWNEAARVRLNGQWGFSRSDGHLIVPVNCDSVIQSFQYPIVWFRQQKKWGMMNFLTGELLLPAAHFYVCNIYPNPYWIVDDGMGYGVVDTTGKWVVPHSYEWLGHNFNAPDNIHFLQNGKFGNINLQDKTIIPAFLDYQIFETLKPFFNGKFWASQNGLWGLIGTDGKWAIPAVYLGVRNPTKRGAWVSPQPGHWGYMDLAGHYLIPPAALDEPYHDFKHGYALVQREQQWGIIGKGGRWLIPPQYKRISPVTAHLFWVISEDGQSVCMNDKKEVIIAESKIYDNGFNHLAVFRKSGWSFVNNKGEWIKKQKLEAIRSFYNHTAIAKSKGKWGLVKDDGSWLAAPAFDEAVSDADYTPGDTLADTGFAGFSIDVEEDEVPMTLMNKLYWFKKNNAWYLTDTTGVFFPKLTFDSAYFTIVINKHLFAVANTTRETAQTDWQIYRFNGTRVSEMWLEDIAEGNPTDTVFSVRYHGKWGLMNNDGAMIIPFIADGPIYYARLIDGRTILQYGGEMIFVNKTGQLSVLNDKK